MGNIKLASLNRCLKCNRDYAYKCFLKDQIFYRDIQHNTFLPHQKYVNNGYFEIASRIKRHHETNSIITLQEVFITPKGQQWLIGRYPELIDYIDMANTCCEGTLRRIGFYLYQDFIGCETTISREEVQQDIEYMLKYLNANYFTLREILCWEGVQEKIGTVTTTTLKGNSINECLKMDILNKEKYAKLGMETINFIIGKDITLRISSDTYEEFRPFLSEYEFKELRKAIVAYELM